MAHPRPPILTLALGIRHLVLDYKLPYRGDAEAQAGRLYHPVYGGGGQGDFRDEAIRTPSPAFSFSLLVAPANPDNS
jgi:hypothetical protein